MNTPQNKAPSKVLACVDPSSFADDVADHGAWAARDGAHSRAACEAGRVFLNRLRERVELDAVGSQVEQVVRALSLPMLVVPAEWTLPQQVLVAFDGSSASRRMVERLASSPLLKGLRVHLLISGTATAQAFDLLVMCGWGHSALRSWLLGSKTTALLRAVKVPVLLLR